MKKRVNKSALIRELRTKNPELSVADIVAHMSKIGNPVSTPLVYQILRTDGSAKKSTGKKRGRKPGSTATATVAPAKAGTDGLFAAMQNFVNAAGGLDKAIAILSVFK